MKAWEDFFPATEVLEAREKARTDVASLRQQDENVINIFRAYNKRFEKDKS